MAFWNNHKPELISIHIPKTAGTSLRNILKNVYGENQVVRFDISMRGVVRLNEAPYNQTQLPAAKVIHGHFSYNAIKEKFGVAENIPVITWLRDPVQRVISNYYYLESRLIEILQEEKKGLHILEKMQRSLIEFARTEINRNRQTKHLDGIALNELKFVGIQENFDSDIQQLAEILNWKKVPDVLHHNKTETFHDVISNDVLEEIHQLNLLDVELYEAALKLRNHDYLR